MRALDYHKQTKHYPNRLAKSLGYLDWANQPNPYKSYNVKRKIPLKIKDLNLSYKSLYLKNEFKEFNFENISSFFENSLSLNAIKEYFNSRWAVRVNPSSGNLHPEESYLIFQNSVYHFNVKEFCLEEIAKSEKELVSEGMVFILTSIPLRESWKYGERALRYCLLDSGHIIASIRFSSNLLGWKMEYIDEFSDSELEKLIGLDKKKWYKNEDEIFEAAFYIYKDKKPVIDFDAFKDLDFHLEYKSLAKEKIRWDIIFDTNLKREEEIEIEFNKSELVLKKSKFSAKEIIQNRRSALGFKRSFINKEDFFDILDKSLRREVPPFDSRAILNKVDLVVFVNRVDGVESGVYYFNKEGEFKLISNKDYSNEARFINCMQDIASDSAFVVSMVIDEEEIKKDFYYKLAMFEAGMIGQVLYLEAEAKGLRGCGIGCFFDDLISIDFLGDKNKLVLYSFSVGEAVIDERIIPIKANQGNLL